MPCQITPLLSCGGQRLLPLGHGRQKSTRAKAADVAFASSHLMRFATLFIVIRLSSPFQGTIHLTKDGKSVAFLPQKVNGESAKLMKDQVFRSENSSLGQSLGIPWETLRLPRVCPNHTRGCCPNARKSEKNLNEKPLRALCVPSAFFALLLRQ